MKTAVILFGLPVLATIGTACGATQVDNAPIAAHEQADARVMPEVGGAAVDQMAVFRRSSTPGDALPSALADEAQLVNQGAPASFRVGELRLPKSRLLLENVGSQNASFYAVPTSSGAVCISGLGGGCVTNFSRYRGGIPIALGDFAGMRAVGGLAPDAVKAITVVIAGARNPAVVANNAYFYELAEEAWPEALVVTYSNGAEETLQIPARPW